MFNKSILIIIILSVITTVEGIDQYDVNLIIPSNGTPTPTPTSVPSSGGGSGGGGGSGWGREAVENLISTLGTNPPYIEANVIGSTMIINIKNEGKGNQEYTINWDIRESANNAVVISDVLSKRLASSESFKIERKLDLKNGNYVLKVTVEYGMYHSDTSKYFTILSVKQIITTKEFLISIVEVFGLIIIFVVVLKKLSNKFMNKFTNRFK